jgi:Tol biopolymer transport system component
MFSKVERIGWLWVIGYLGLAACANTPTLPPLSTLAPTTPPQSTAAPPLISAATFTPNVTATPRPTNLPTATPEPLLRALTTGGCCVQPFFAPNGQAVWFIDKPSETSPSGLWGVPLTGGEPQFITEKIGLLSADGTLMAYPQAGQTYVERVATGERWTVPTAGRAIFFSPDNQLIAWQEASASANFDRRQVTFWVAQADGTNARSVLSVIGGGLAGWMPDSQRLLITGRESFDVDPYLATVHITDRTLTGLARSLNIRNAVPSPGSGWVAYQINFTGDLAQDGLWIAKTDGRAAKKLSVFGAFRWRTENQLLVLPLELGRGGQRVLQVEAATAQVSVLVPETPNFRIAAGDWNLAPDGNQLIFVNADDRNIWLMNLPSE